MHAILPAKEHYHAFELEALCAKPTFKTIPKGALFLFSSPESHRKNIIPIIDFVIPYNEQIIDKLADEHSWNQISKFRTHEKKIDFQFFTS